MVKEVPKTYETTDGATFEDRKLAEDHQELLDAIASFRDAEALLNRCLMESATTADGYPFSFEPWHYYAIEENWIGLPRLTEIGTLTLASEARSCVARVHRDDREVILVYYSTARRDERLYQRNEISVGSLYRKKENAMRALVAAQKERLAAFAEEVGETARKAGEDVVD